MARRIKPYVRPALGADAAAVLRLAGDLRLSDGELLRVPYEATGETELERLDAVSVGRVLDRLRGKAIKGGVKESPPARGEQLAWLRRLINANDWLRLAEEKRGGLRPAMSEDDAAVEIVEQEARLRGSVVHRVDRDEDPVDRLRRRVAARTSPGFERLWRALNGSGWLDPLRSAEWQKLEEALAAAHRAAGRDAAVRSLAACVVPTIDDAGTLATALSALGRASKRALRATRPELTARAVAFTVGGKRVTGARAAKDDGVDALIAAADAALARTTVEARFRRLPAAASPWPLAFVRPDAFDRAVAAGAFA